MIKAVGISGLFKVEISAVFYSLKLQNNRIITLHNIYYVKLISFFTKKQGLPHKI